MALYCELREQMDEANLALTCVNTSKTLFTLATNVPEIFETI